MDGELFRVERQLAACPGGGPAARVEGDVAAGEERGTAAPGRRASARTRATSSEKSQGLGNGYGPGTGWQDVLRFGSLTERQRDILGRLLRVRG
jgi:hypothetical protein